jgi:transposase
MEVVMIAVGIDIAKTKFDVVILKGKRPKHKMFDNNDKGFKALQSWLTSSNPEDLHLCMEATNSYGFALAYFMTSQGYRVSIVNPKQIKAHAESELSRNKTDKLDATIIAKFCLEKSPRPWQPSTVKTQEFQALYRRWETLKDMAAQEKNRLDCERNGQVCSSIESHLAYLDEHLHAVESALDLLVQDDPALKQNYHLLQSR